MSFLWWDALYENDRIHNTETVDEDNELLWWFLRITRYTYIPYMQNVHETQFLCLSILYFTIKMIRYICMCLHCLQSLTQNCIKENVWKKWKASFLITFSQNKTISIRHNILTNKKLHMKFLFHFLSICKEHTYTEQYSM